MYTDLGQNFNDIVVFTKNKINQIRENNNGTLKFVQLGANNGINPNDIVNIVTEPSDEGILVEPHPEVFLDLIKNKPLTLYPNYTFYNFGVIPNKFEYLTLKFKKQVSGGYPQGNHFISGPTRHGVDFIDGTANIVYLNDFITNYVKTPIDCLIMDIEGFDSDIVAEYLKFDKPKLICYEAWNFNKEQIKSMDIDFLTKEEILDILEKHGYEVFKCNDDFCAINM